MVKKTTLKNDNIVTLSCEIEDVVEALHKLRDEIKTLTGVLKYELDNIGEEIAKSRRGNF